MLHFSLRAGPLPYDQNERIDKMRDEIDARIWNEHGHQFSEALHRFLQGVALTFRRLHAIQFHAPWRDTKSC